LNLNVIHLGVTDYQKGLELQHDLVKKRQDNLITDTLLLLEHPPVITMGRRADNSHLKADDSFFKDKGITIHRIDRGGEATYHGPGQIVGYVIVDLNQRKGFVKQFVWEIEEVFIRLLKNEFNIDSHRDMEHRGVWVGNEKITAVGISVKRNVTMHGFAFNVNTDVSAYSWIIPCGITDKGVTSLEKLTKQKIDIENMKKITARYFKDVFYPETEEKSPAKALVRTRYNEEARKVDALIKKLKLNTVCSSASCPNRGECFSHKTATFMILGNSCTRRCTFCNVKKGVPEIVDPKEPERIVEAVRQLGLEYIVITSVTRDDLPDGGSQHFAECIQALKNSNPKIQVEVLIPDFQGNPQSLQTVLNAEPEVLNHNIETVPGLYPKVRPQAIYERSLKVLSESKRTHPHIITKSGIMLGLGETDEEVITVLKDMRAHLVDSVTIGQYLAPSLKHHKIVRRLSDKEFKRYETIAMELGFDSVASGKLVRSSYKADELYKKKNYTDF